MGTIGSANLAAGVRDAYMAGSPVIALTGGVAAGSRYKHVYQVEVISDVDAMAKRAWRP